MAEIIDVANAMFKTRSLWASIKDEDKEKFFFIFNRYFTKRYPEQCHMLNLKTTDKSQAMDLWFYFMKDKPYPQWFWSKSPVEEKSNISDKDFKLLQLRLKLKEFDLDYLVKNFPDFIKEELKYYKQLDKQ